MNALKKMNRQLFKDSGFGAVLLKYSDSFPDSSLSYFSGLAKQFLSNNTLILRPDAKPFLLKSILEPKEAAPGLIIQRIDRRKQFKTVLRKELKGVKALGINKPLHSSTALKELKKAIGKKKLVDVSKKIAAMRAIKSREEIATISKACKIAQSVSEKVPRLFRKGMTEKQLAMQVEILLREKGENILPFPVIVASGKNAAYPHQVPSGKKIAKGLLLLDFGAYSKNYCSDISRVFCVGRPSKGQRRLYASVFAAKQFGQAMIGPGISQSKIFDKANTFLKRETGKQLIHGLGHGLGVDAHDFPAGFLHDNREKLQQDMVLTVEPAVYGKFGGVRVEDDVVVTGTGCKPLTKAPADLIQI